MDKQLSVQQKSPKQGKGRMGNIKAKKPIKVVYISNPMKVKTTAAGFRACVQELTGRDSHVADNPDGYPAALAAHVDDDYDDADDDVDGDGDGSLAAIPRAAAACRQSPARPAPDPAGVDPYASVVSPFDMFDHEAGFAPAMLDGYVGFMPMLYEAHAAGAAFRNFGQV